MVYPDTCSDRPNRLVRYRHAIAGETKPVGRTPCEVEGEGSIPRTQPCVQLRFTDSREVAVAEYKVVNTLGRTDLVSSFYFLKKNIHFFLFLSVSGQAPAVTASFSLDSIEHSYPNHG